VIPTDAGRTGNPAGAPGEFFGAVDYTVGDVAASARLAAGAQENPQWFDVLRRLHADQEEGPYSWWTWRGKAFDTGAGWRIDYQVGDVLPDGACRERLGGQGARLRPAVE
jgi:exodeoxyribonuclease-3